LKSGQSSDQIAASAAQRLSQAEAFWASPLTRALQTAIVGLAPILSQPGKKLEVKPNAREKKNFGGLDSIGRVTGQACYQRALQELKALDQDGGPTPAELSEVQNLSVDPTEVEDEWWNEGAEDDFSLTSRLDELLHQAEHSAAETIVLVGHSHFFREVFRRFLHPTFHLTDPHLARTLQSKSIPNCTVLACEFDFAMRPYVIRHVNEIRFAPPPATRRVEAQLTRTRGVILCATCRCVRDDVLLEVPLSSCLTSEEAPSAAALRLPPGDAYGRLLLALLHRLETQPAHPHSAYFEAVFNPSEAQSQIMSLWKEEAADLAATRAAGSVAWERARRQRASMTDEWRHLTEAALCAAPHGVYLWAKCVLRTRAFSLPGTGPALVPLIDLANHLTIGATARWRLADAHGTPHVQLLANYTLDPGDEVTQCYDADADFLDMFERYGFFDGSAVVHTAEVLVDPSALLAGCGESLDSGERAAGSEAGEDRTGLEDWRADLVAAQAVAGRDSELHAWWVPDTAIESCPLFAAVRATLISREELHRATGGSNRSGDTGDGDDAASKVLRRPIAREAEARAKLAELLQAQLARYACTAEQAARDLKSGLLTTTEEAATRLLHFESTLLEAQLKALCSARK